MVQKRNCRLLAVLAALIVAGCQPRMSTQTPLMRRAPNLDITATELRIRVRTLTERFAAVIEIAADEIIAAADEAQVRHNALLWKVEAIPAAHSALLRPDPAAACLDTWAFSEQMLRYLETGAGRQLFGQQQPIAVEAARRLRREIRRLIESVASRPETELEAMIETWAEANPIEGMLFGRIAISADIADQIASDAGSALASIGRLTDDLTDLSVRLGMINEHLLKQARWQAELLLADIAGVPAVRGVATDVERVAVATRGLADTFRTGAALLEGTEERLGQRLARAAEATTTFVRDERETVLSELSAELDRLTVELHEVLQAELHAAGAAYDRERPKLLAEVEGLGDRLIARSSGELRGLIDHLFWRALQLLAVAFILVGVIMWRWHSTAAA